MNKLIENIENSSQRLCLHCQEDAANSSFAISNEQGEIFCCSGCRSVYSFIQENQLSKYYQLKNQFGQKEDGVIQSQFESLDKESFAHWNKEEFTSSIRKSPKANEIEIFAIQIHCVACSWIIEKSLLLIDGVEECDVNLFKKSIHVKFTDQVRLSDIAHAIYKVGYTPQIGRDESHLKHIKKQMLLEIGVSAFCAGNIMLFSVAQYAGSQGEWTALFNWLSFILFVPILTFCSKSFFKKAWASLKTKLITVDLSISLVLILASSISLFRILSGNYDHYFDSLSIFVFLFLSSRYFLEQIEQRHQKLVSQNFYFPQEIYQKVKAINEKGVDIAHQDVQKGDMLLIKQEQNVYFTSKVLSSEGLVNYAYINGESEPVALKAGQTIESGAINLSKEIYVEVLETYQESSFSKTIETLKKEWIKNNSFIEKTNKLSSALLIFSLLTSTLLLVIGGMSQLDKVLAILIITCPCALSLAAPLVYSNGLSKLFKAGIFVKRSQTFEKLNKVTDVFFDKTGTITNGFEVQFANDFSQKLKNYLYSLTLLSIHPLSRAIKDSLQKTEIYKVEEFKEIVGVGIKGRIGQNTISLKSHEIKGRKQLIFSVNEIMITEIQIQESLRKDVKSLFRYLKKRKIKSHILSGDSEAKVEQIAKQLEENSFFSRVKPEDKSKIIKDYPNSLMIGDGLNDIYALADSLVGVAFQEVSKVNLSTSDIFLKEQNISLVEMLLKVSRTINKRMILTLSLSFLFNLTGLGFAVYGYVNPLVAAIAMPINSLIVVGLSSRNMTLIKV